MVVYVIKHDVRVLCVSVCVCMCVCVVRVLYVCVECLSESMCVCVWWHFLQFSFIRLLRSPDFVESVCVSLYYMLTE